MMTEAKPLGPIHHVYYGYHRTECEVCVAGVWHFGEIRSWDRDERGAWSAYVMWSTGPGQGNQLGRFPSDQIRAVLPD